jgi:hypothetical protein
MKITTNLRSQRWSSESSRTDGLADTRVYMQLAMAMEIYERVEDDQNVVEVVSKP